MRDRHPLHPKVLATDAMTLVNRAIDSLPVTRHLCRHVLRRLTVTERVWRIPDLALDLDGLRLLWVSDIHAGSFIRDTELQLVRDSIEAAEPDLLLHREGHMNLAGVPRP